MIGRIMLVLLGLTLAALVTVGGCIGGIGNKTTTTNVAANIQIQNGYVVAVQDADGNWIMPELAPVELLVERDVVRIATGQYIYKGGTI